MCVRWRGRRWVGGVSRGSGEGVAEYPARRPRPRVGGRRVGVGVPSRSWAVVLSWPRRLETQASVSSNRGILMRLPRSWRASPWRCGQNTTAVSIHRRGAILSHRASRILYRGAGDRERCRRTFQTTDGVGGRLGGGEEVQRGYEEGGSRAAAATRGVERSEVSRILLPATKRYDTI